MVSTYVKDTWTEAMVKLIRERYPDEDKETIEKYVLEQFEKDYRDTECDIFNSYEQTVAHTSLGKTVDWIQVYHPIMSESGVFFYPKSEKRNVNTEIIREYMLDARTVHKQEKFEAMKRGDLFTAAVKDLQQGNDKKAANSGYGAEGQASSFLFDVQSAMSVTAAGRGQLSTMILCFEDLFEDNVKFWNMDEFYGFISNIVAEKKTR